MYIFFIPGFDRSLVLSLKSGTVVRCIFRDFGHDAKKRFPLSEDELKKLQIEIEDRTMLFDEQSMFKTVPNIIKRLIKHDKNNAKDYLKRKLHEMDSIEL